MSPAMSPLRGEEPAPAAHGLGAELPLLDMGILRDLDDQVGEALGRDFGKDYMAMWDYRWKLLVTALADPEGREDALDAVISVKVSSAMVGATRLAGLAATLERQIRQGTLPVDVTALTGFSACGQATVQELRRRYCDAA